MSTRRAASRTRSRSPSAAVRGDRRPATPSPLGREARPPSAAGRDRLARTANEGMRGRDTKRKEGTDERGKSAKSRAGHPGPGRARREGREAGATPGRRPWPRPGRRRGCRRRRRRGRADGRRRRCRTTTRPGDPTDRARMALSWVRSNAGRYRIDPAFHCGADIHVHVQSGVLQRGRGLGRRCDGGRDCVCADRMHGPLRSGHDRRDHTLPAGRAGRWHQGERARRAAACLASSSRRRTGSMSKSSATTSGAQPPSTT